MLQPLLEVRRYRTEVHGHTHEFHQVVLPLQGRLEMTVGDARGAVSPRWVALVAAGQPHSFTGSEGNAFLVADIPKESPPVQEPLGALLWQHAGRSPFVRIDAELRRLIDYLAREVERGMLVTTLSAPACALLLGAIAARLGLDEEGGWPPGLRAACGYIDAHLEWPIEVADLARVAHVSSSRLHALFREHLETSPQRHVTRRRLERASDLLRHTALPVADVAQRVGYSDQAAFSRAFRRHTGHSPLAYRRTDRHKIR